MFVEAVCFETMRFFHYGESRIFTDENYEFFRDFGYNVIEVNKRFFNEQEMRIQEEICDLKT